MPTLVLRYEHGDLPVWASAKTVHKLFGIGYRALLKLNEDGTVKSRKLPGDVTRAGRVYRIADIESYLNGGAT